MVVGASSFAVGSNRAIDLLIGKGIEVVKNPYGRKMTEKEIIEHLKGADGLLAGLEPLNENVFSKSPGLRAIARIGIGMDNVDIAAAGRYGIKVSNTPDGPTEAVAEMTLAALLTIIHNIIPSNDDMHGGEWKKRIGRSIKELTVFVIGCGRIGRRVADQMRSMGAEVLTYDKYFAHLSNCSFEDGLRRADVITLHASGNDTILSENEFRMMKDGVVILNSARGSLISEDTLYDSLKDGKTSWFWGDTFWEEPYSGKLTELSNAILTPHICTYTVSCRDEMEMQATVNILKDLGY